MADLKGKYHMRNLQQKATVLEKKVKKVVFFAAGCTQGTFFIPLNGAALYNIILKTAIGIEIEAKYDLGWTDQYMFQFKYVRPQDIPQMGNLNGHGYFLLYFCGLEIYLSNGISHTAEDNLVQNNLAQVFYNFVKGQSPSSNGVSIPKVTANKIPYMLVGKDVVIEETDIKQKVDFWKQLSADYQYDLLRQIHL
uniref:Carboxylesterase n=1 Tax=Panagrolaimus davidi TaxID=227884 RepID=A0A914QL08_9BILA